MAEAGPSIEDVLEEILSQVDNCYRQDTASKTAAFREHVPTLTPEQQRDLVLLALARIGELRRAAEEWRSNRRNDNPEGWRRWNVYLNRWGGCRGTAAALLNRTLPWDREQFRDLLTCFAEGDGHSSYPMAGLLKQIEANPGLFAEHRGGKAVARIRQRIEAMIDPAARRLQRRFAAILGEQVHVPVQPGEAWSDRVLADLGDMDADERALWSDLLTHCADASGGAPSAKWLKPVRAAIDEIGSEGVQRRLLEWFPLVDKPRTTEHRPRHQYDPDSTHRIIDPHMEILKGLCWLAGTIPSPDLARTLGRLAISAYRKVPGVGPRAVKVGNAAVYALGRMPGMDAVGQLAMLRVKVKFGTAQKGIEKALAAAAEREGLPREEIDELGVPSYGLTEVGRRVEEIEGHRVELVVTGIGDTEMRFTKPDGKAVKSAPAAIKGSQDLKELKAAVKDIAAMLPAQRDRIDGLFLENKTWPLGVWRERYLDHPLVGVAARRLIWRVGDADARDWAAVTWLDEAEGGPAGGGLVDVEGNAADLGAAAAVRLWHPIDAAGGTEEIMAWRRFFEDRRIRQPFKQAHREVYLLTDAERNTGSYSNRFAAHIVRQHQFHALCGVRGWKNKLRLMVDAEYPPPTRRLAAWDLRAEFWVEGAGEETNESGAYLYLATDQVRFYNQTAAQTTAHAGGGGYGMHAHPGAAVNEPLPLERVPPLVLSEVMRDVDLFVGVGSVGNNPEWQDGGPEGRYRDYWWGYSFGDLAETGRTRRDLLARLIPRLKIAGVCELDDKFLRVRGKLRTYKIHLGSGNILMEPNDQYLCIVPGSRSGASATGGDVFLPFEGDRTLAIILSKAFMLAEDDRITDPSITRQIGRR